jgi:hypothetical protein
MANEEMRILALAAGVTEDEMQDHPEHGLTISLTGLRKLAAAMPDTAQKWSLWFLSSANSVLPISRLLAPVTMAARFPL